MYYFTYDPWVGKQLYLEDFYVMEPYRGTGDHGPARRSLRHFTSSAPSNFVFLLLLPGLGIGSELLRHLSDVSIDPKLFAAQCRSSSFIPVSLPVGDQDALHGHDVHRGREQRAVHPVLQAARRRRPLSGGRLAAFQVQQEQPRQDGHSS